MLALRKGADLALAIKLRKPDGDALFSGHEPAELQVIGQNPVWQRVAVALELPTVCSLAAFHVIEVNADAFSLNVAERDLVARDVEIGGAARDALGLVGSRDAIARSFK